MKIKLLVSRSGIGFSQIRGDEVEVGDDEGVRMVDAGQALPLNQEEFNAAKVAYQDALVAQAKAAEPETTDAPLPEVTDPPQAETAVAKAKPEKAAR